MAYEVTASRKRPQSFDELIGQDFIVATLTSAVRQKKIAHAYLFSGPRGVGKTSAARILAKGLNCDSGPTDEPCGTCDACLEITQGNSIDVIEIDGASNTSVNDVREIKDEVLFSPSSLRYKIYIIDEVHMLSNSAFNALLKTIEEPPPYIVFIFATTEIHKVPATIRSRCQQFNFRLISIGDIRDALRKVVEENEIQAETEALLWIAREATGSLRDAYTLLDQIIAFSEEKVTLEKIREKLGIIGVDELNDLAALLMKGSTPAALKRIDEILDRGVAAEQFVINLVSYFRNLLFIRHGVQEESILGYSIESFDVDLIKRAEPLMIEKGLEILLDLYRRMRFSLNQRFELELVVSRLCRLDRLITEEEILSRLEDLKNDSGVTKVTTGPPNNELAEGGVGADVAEKIISQVKREKPALASALSKAISISLEGRILRILFNGKDRFAGELIAKEQNLIKQKAVGFLEHPVEIKLEYSEADQEKETREGEDVEIVRRVFKGEIIQGE